jgi:hypothetical protein
MLREVPDARGSRASSPEARTPAEYTDRREERWIYWWLGADLGFRAGADWKRTRLIVRTRGGPRYRFRGLPL